MNTRFHVPTRVFGSRRGREERLDEEPGSQVISVLPATITGSDPALLDPALDDSPGRSASYLIPGARTALIDPGSAIAAPRILETLKFSRVNLELILLTHIHPDAAAGTGLIAEHFPGARILAPAGASDLLADPAAYVAGMKDVYGERVESIHGTPLPIEQQRITTLGDGERIDLGDRMIEVISTPGHTAAHISFFDPSTSSLFCGDALGVQLSGSPVVRPSTPPRDFSLEESLASIERLRAVGAEAVYRAHFGAARPGPDGIYQQAADTLRRWHRSFLQKQEQTDSEEDLSREFNACVEVSLEPIAPSVRRDLESVSPAWLNLAGLSAEQDRLRRSLSDAA